MLGAPTNVEVQLRGGVLVFRPTTEPSTADAHFIRSALRVHLELPRT